MKGSGLLVAALVFSIIAGCVTVGRDFRSDSFTWIVQGRTTKAEVYKKLGEPFRMGVDAGKVTWTYGYYRYTGSSSLTKDLVIYFNPDNTVASYSFSTSFPEEKDKWREKTGP